MAGKFSINKLSPPHYEKKSLLKNISATLGLIITTFVCIISLLSYLVIPDKTIHANEAALQIRKQVPVFRVTMLKFRKNVDIKEVNFFEKIFYGKENLYTIVPVIGKIVVRKDSAYFTPYPGREKKILAESLLNCVKPLYVGASNKLGESVRSNYIVGKDSITFIDIKEEIIRISKKNLEKEFYLRNIEERTYWLGTDRSGRDILSRLIYSTKISLIISLLSAIISLIIGIFMGVLAGLLSNKVSSILWYIIDVFKTIPSIILIIIILLTLNNHSIWYIALAIGLSIWVKVASIVKNQIILIKTVPYIQLMKNLEFSPKRILFKHIFPNIAPILLVASISNLAFAVLMEASMSFLGLGVNYLVPSWGIMLKEGFESLGTRQSWHLVLMPGLCISIMILGFRLLEKGLKEIYNIGFFYNY